MRNIKRAGILTVAAISALLIGVSAAGADHGGLHCDELPPNITSGHPDWDESLDADHDGIGCEDGSGGEAPEPQPEPGPGSGPAPSAQPPVADQAAADQSADIDCGDPGTSHNMPVGPDDPHGLDADDDGVGCEDPSVFGGGPAPAAAPAEPLPAEPTFTG